MGASNTVLFDDWAGFEETDEGSILMNERVVQGGFIECCSFFFFFFYQEASGEHGC